MFYTLWNKFSSNRTYRPIKQRQNPDKFTNDFMVVGCYANLLFLSTSHEMQQRPSYTVVENTICKGDDRKNFFYWSSRLIIHQKQRLSYTVVGEGKTAVWSQNVYNISALCTNGSYAYINTLCTTMQGYCLMSYISTIIDDILSAEGSILVEA